MLDFIILFILILFILFGVLRGFIKELLSIIGIILSIIITINNYDIIIRIFEIENNLLVFNIISTLCVFIISMIIIILIQSWITYVLYPIRLGFFDRFFGFFLGALKGVFISYLALTIINIFYYSLHVEPDIKHKESAYKSEKILPIWVKSSFSHDCFLIIDPYVSSLIPQDFTKQLSEFGNSITKTPDKEGRKMKN